MDNKKKNNDGLLEGRDDDFGVYLANKHKTAKPAAKQTQTTKTSEKKPAAKGKK